MALFDSSFLSYAVLVAAAAVLFSAALTDLTRFVIPNELIVVLILLFLAHNAISGRWSELPWHLAFALLAFCLFAWFYGLGWMGGGDIKLLTVALLWTGIHCALLFAVLLLFCTCLYTVAAKLGWAAAQRDSTDKRMRIALAPSIAAALVGVFMLGCLQPPA